MLRRPIEPTQDTSIWFTEHQALESITPSIGTVGEAYDDGLMESIIGLFQTSASAPRSTTPAPPRLVDIEYAAAGWVE